MDVNDLDIYDYKICVLNTTLNKINELEQKYNDEKIIKNKNYDIISYKYTIIKCLICALKYNKPTNKNIRFLIPINYDDKIITYILNDLINNNLITLNFIFFDKITEKNESFDVNWIDTEKLYNYLTLLNYETFNF